MAFLETALTQLDFPESLQKVGRAAFSNCNSLERVTFTSPKTEIDDGAFSGCSNLKWVKLPEHLKVLRISTFFSCISLTSVRMPYKVTTIEGHGDHYGNFQDCALLMSVVIPRGCETIQFSAFEACVSLVNVALLPNCSLDYSMRST